jgi:hypothetical protein
VFIVLKVHVYVLSRKDWVLSETGVTPPILPGNIPSCIFGKILFTALVCILLWFYSKLGFLHKRLWENCCQFIVNCTTFASFSVLLDRFRDVTLFSSCRYTVDEGVKWDLHLHSWNVKSGPYMEMAFFFSGQFYFTLLFFC